MSSTRNRNKEHQEKWKKKESMIDTKSGKNKIERKNTGQIKKEKRKNDR